MMSKLEGYYQPQPLDRYDECLATNRGYKNGCDMNWGINTSCDWGGTSVIYEGAPPFSTAIADQYLSEGIPIIAKTTATGVSQHFVVIVGKSDNNDYVIMDPWDGEYHLMSLGALGKYTPRSFRIYNRW